MPLGVDGLNGEKLKDDVRTLGGKNGIQHFLREQQVEGLTILPSEILLPNDRPDFAMRRRLRALCKDCGTDSAIVRTSIESDLNGLVDVLPTIKDVPIGLLLGSDLAEVVRSARKECHSAVVKQFAEIEGSPYKPEKVSISITPFLRLKRAAIVTEHPNQNGVVLIDIVELWRTSDGEELQPEYTTYESLHNTIQPSRRTSTTISELLPSAEKAKDVLSRVRSTGYFTNDTALQLEIGFHPKDNRTVLLQVRQLAEIKRANFAVPTESPITINTQDKLYLRAFGITPSEGLRLSIVRCEIRGDYQRFESEHSGTPYILVPNNISAPLEPWECPSSSMKGYIVDLRPKPALPHQNTRFVQMALKQGGIAILAAPAEFASKLTRNSEMIFYSNGYQFVATPVEN